MTAPDLHLYGRDGARRGDLRPCGAVLHRDELGGEDTLELACERAPEKYDRIVWRDPVDGRWREHVVVRIDEAAGGGCEVYAESCLADLACSFIEERRLSGATAAEAARAVLGPAGWKWSVEGLDAEAGCLLYRTNRLAALRRVCEVWGAEPDPWVEVGPGGVEARGVALRARVGAWCGARLSYGRNLGRLVRTVDDGEVFTALYGFGAGLPVMDDEGAWTGGYARRLTFGSVNGGVSWVGDEAAREEWGLPLADGTRAHRFGSVSFPGETDPARLLERTRVELARASSPQVGYVAEAAIDARAVPICLGDEVLLKAGDDPWEPPERVRVVARERVLGEGPWARYELGRPLRRSYAEVSDAFARADEAGEGALAASAGAEAARAAAGEVRAAAGWTGGAVPALATREYVDGLFAGLADLSEEEF